MVGEGLFVLLCWGLGVEKIFLNNCDRIPATSGKGKNHESAREGAKTLRNAKGRGWEGRGGIFRGSGAGLGRLDGFPNRGLRAALCPVNRRKCLFHKGRFQRVTNFGNILFPFESCLYGEFVSK